MTQDERTAQDAAARLDARLGELPLEVAPGRDLWPEIAARIEESAHTDKHESARELLKQREGDVSKGAPLTAQIGRLRFDEAAQDLLTDYKVNKKTIQVPVDWKPDVKLLRDMAAARVAEISD